MSPLIQFQRTSLPIVIVSLLTCFALSQMALAISPLPDGGYADGNTAEGTDALFSFTGISPANGGFNTAIGFKALSHNTGGSTNTATGYSALFKNSKGTDNIADGFEALFNNTTGLGNVAIGSQALMTNATTGFNVAVGRQALLKNTGPGNTAVGDQALLSNTSAGSNTAIGGVALFSNKTGAFNTAVGAGALESSTAGFQNTAVGDGAGGIATGNNGVFIGQSAGENVTTADNVICIGAFELGANVGNSCYIANIRGVTTAHMNAVPVVIDSTGQLGTVSSSERFKKDIKPMDKSSEALLALKPVTFHYKSDNTSTPQFGLVAEDVAKVNPDLIVRDADGQIYSVRYDAVNAMLLNEFLKEHRKVEGLTKDFQVTIAQQQKEIADLAATVKEQAAQIQKVSAQLEVSKPAPQTVLNQ